MYILCLSFLSQHIWSLSTLATFPDVACTCNSIHTHIHTYIHIDIHIYIYMHTHINIYQIIYIYILNKTLPLLVNLFIRKIIGSRNKSCRYSDALPQGQVQIIHAPNSIKWVLLFSLFRLMIIFVLYILKPPAVCCNVLSIIQLVNIIYKPTKFLMLQNVARQTAHIWPLHTVQFLKMSDRNKNDFFPINDSKWSSRTNTGFFLSK